MNFPLNDRFASQNNKDKNFEVRFFKMDHLKAQLFENYMKF